MWRNLSTFAAAIILPGILLPVSLAAEHDDNDAVQFSMRSIKDGRWSDSATWQPAKVPMMGDRVLISRGTTVEYDVASKDVLRLIQVVGTLSFARDRDTELNVALLKVQNSDNCSESGFACDFLHKTKAGEPTDAPEGSMPALLVGTPDHPIPAEHTARIRLHYLDGMNKEDAPAIACCSARMEIHGAPLKRTWVKLAGDAKPHEDKLILAETVSDWHVGDEVIVTASERGAAFGTYRAGTSGTSQARTEARHVAAMDGTTVTLDNRWNSPISAPVNSAARWQTYLAT